MIKSTKLKPLKPSRSSLSERVCVLAAQLVVLAERVSFIAVHCG